MAVLQQVARPEGADPQLVALRVPPHSVEAEQSLLGALLIDNAAFDRVHHAFANSTQAGAPDLKAEEQEFRAQGLNEEEVADTIANGATDAPGESRLVDSLIGDAAAAARQQALIEAERVADEDGEDDEDEE